jgi:hypothetical protein
MDPKHVSSYLRKLAHNIQHAERPSRKLVAKNIQRVFLAMENLSGFKVQKAEVSQYEPVSQEHPQGVVSGQFILISPSGKTIAVSGTSDNDNVDLDITIDGIPWDAPNGIEMLNLGELDPESFLEDSEDGSMDESRPLWDLLLEVAASKQHIGS